MKITQATETSSAPGPVEYFTGTVIMDGIRMPDEQSAAGSAHVKFAPGARTAWHTHPHGQTIYVTDGIGWVGTRDQKREVRAGDVVYFEPGEEHWHGAATGKFMSHVAIHEADENGSTVTWLEHVADEDYLA